MSSARGKGSEPRPGNSDSPAVSLGRSLDGLWVENCGQWPTEARFVARTASMLVRAEPGAFVLQLPSPTDRSAGVLVRMAFEGARASVELEGVESQEGLFHFYRGADASRWITGARSYRAVRWRGLYEGIDVLAYEINGRLEYDVLVEPGADLSRFIVRCEGIDGLEVGDDGALRLDTACGPLIQPTGRTWQVGRDGRIEQLVCCPKLMGGGAFGLDVRGRALDLALTIDPELVWSTYLGSSMTLGGPGDIAMGCDLDPAGNVVVVGRAAGTNFPATPGAYQHPHGSTEDGFVTRFRHDGTLLYSSIIGGNENVDQMTAVAVEPNGRATVAGNTGSLDFPTTPGAFNELHGNGTAFVLRLSPNGDQLEYSTYLGGYASEAFDVAVDASGAATVVGQSQDGFPTTPGAYKPQISGANDGFVSRLTSAGDALQWSTYLGGSSLDRVTAVALTPSGAVLVGGMTASTDLPTTPASFQPSYPGGGSHEPGFIARLALDGSNLEWITYLGGTQIDSHDNILALAAGPFDDPVVVGSTRSIDFPTTSGVVQPVYSGPPDDGFAGDAFITRLDRTGSSLVFSTFLGAPYPDAATDVAVDKSGVVTLAGSANGYFPTTAGSFDPTYNGSADAFVARLNPSATRLLYSSLFGSFSLDYFAGLGVTPSGRVALAGTNYGGGYPVTPGAYDTTYNAGQSDIVVTVIDLLPDGVLSLGTATPSCLGPLVLGAMSKPTSGQDSFGFWCSQAPPSARGWLFVATAALAAPAQIAGVDLWLDRSSIRAIRPLVSDAQGYVEVSLPLGSVAAGSRFYAQSVFRSSPGCGVPGTLCASQALEITVR